MANCAPPTPLPQIARRVTDTLFRKAISDFDEIGRALLFGQAAHEDHSFGLIATHAINKWRGTGQKPVEAIGYDSNVLARPVF